MINGVVLVEGVPIIKKSIHQTGSCHQFLMRQPVRRVFSSNATERWHTVMHTRPSAFLLLVNDSMTFIYFPQDLPGCQLTE